jgi:cytochrome c heme-lyase
MNEPSSEESEEFEFSSMSQVFEYMRLTNTHLDDQQLRIIAAGISYRAAWKGIMEWERLPRPLSSCPPDQVKFVKLILNEPPTWKSRILKHLGYPTPFERHDYLVSRCNSELRYTIEFYSTSDTEFTVDARPCFNGGRGWVDRILRRPLQLAWSRLFSNS